MLLAHMLLGFAMGLDGDEDVLVVEFGEGRPEVMSLGFRRRFQPNVGVITGIAPAHLDQYPSLDAAAQDIFSLQITCTTTMCM